MNSPPWLTKNVWGFSLASLCSDSSHEIVPLVLPVLLTSLVGSQNAPPYVGLISGFATFIASCAILFSGWLSDRLSNRKPLLLIGYALSGLLVGCLGFAHSWQTVLILVSLAWFGRGLCSAPRNAIIADSVPRAFYGHAFGFRQAFDTLGAIIGPILVYFLSQSSLKTLFSLSFIPGIFAFLIIAFFVQDVPHQISPQKKLFDTQGFSLQFYILVAITILFGLANFNKTLLILRVQNILEHSHSQTYVLSCTTLLYIFRNSMQTIAAYYMGALSDRIGRTLPLSICGFGFFGIMALLLMYPSSNFTYLMTIFFFSGVSAGTFMTLSKTLAADLLPEAARGTGYGILQITNSMADLASSVIVGFLWSTFSPESAFLWACFISMAAAYLLLKSFGCK